MSEGAKIRIESFNWGDFFLNAFFYLFIISIVLAVCGWLDLFYFLNPHDSLQVAHMGTVNVAVPNSLPPLHPIFISLLSPIQVWQPGFPIYSTFLMVVMILSASMVIGDIREHLLPESASWAVFIYTTAFFGLFLIGFSVLGCAMFISSAALWFFLRQPSLNPPSWGIAFLIVLFSGIALLLNPLVYGISTVIMAWLLFRQMFFNRSAYHRYNLFAFATLLALILLDRYFFGVDFTSLGAMPGLSFERWSLADVSKVFQEGARFSGIWVLLWFVVVTLLYFPKKVGYWISLLIVSTVSIVGAIILRIAYPEHGAVSFLFFWFPFIYCFYQMLQSDGFHRLDFLRGAGAPLKSGGFFMVLFFLFIEGRQVFENWNVRMHTLQGYYHARSQENLLIFSNPGAYFSPVLPWSKFIEKQTWVIIPEPYVNNPVNFETLCKQWLPGARKIWVVNEEQKQQLQAIIDKNHLGEKLLLQSEAESPGLNLISIQSAYPTQ